MRPIHCWTDMLFIRLSTGAIVGISIGAVLAALLAFILIFRQLWPSITLRLKRTSNQNQHIQAFEHPISVNEPASGSGLTTALAHRPAPPPTALSSAFGGMSSSRPTRTTVRISYWHLFSLPYTEYLIIQTQMATMPYTPDGKYRPDLVSAPQNMRSPSQGHERSDSTAIQTESTLQSSSSSAMVQQQQPRSSDQPRGPVNGANEAVPPPQYELDPSWGGHEVSTFLSIMNFKIDGPFGYAVLVVTSFHMIAFMMHIYPFLFCVSPFPFISAQPSPGSVFGWLFWCQAIPL